MRFVDTNVLLYRISRAPEERSKRLIAEGILHSGDLRVSAQVLQEFYVQATRTTRDGALSHKQAAGLIGALARFPVQPTTVHLVLAAMDASDRFGLSYWDAAIIEAARMLGCSEVLSEDLGHGQDYGGVVVRNPFR